MLRNDHLCYYKKTHYFFKMKNIKKTKKTIPYKKELILKFKIY